MILFHCNVANSQYQHDARALSTFVPSKSFSQLLNISSDSHICTERFYSEFSYIEVWFTDRNSMPLEKKDRINLTLIINDMGIKAMKILRVRRNPCFTYGVDGVSTGSSPS